MLNLIDLDKGLLDASLKKRRHFILFLISSIVAIVSIFLLIFFSDEHYVFELILTILISIAYLFYLVFYFSVIRRCIGAELRLYEGAKKAEFHEINCELISLGDEIKEYNNLEYYVLEAKEIENLREENKIFYAAKKFSFKKNQKAKLIVYGSIIIDVELRK